MASLNLNTNVEEIEIIKNGENIGVIRFDASDTSILARLREVAEKSNKEYDALRERIGNMTEDEAFDEMTRVDGILREYVNYALGAKVDDIAFKDTFCFTSKNGVTLIEQFLSGVLDICEKSMGKESKAAEKRVAKYVKNYHR